MTPDTQERIRRIKEFWHPGITSTEIARTLGVTRNSVIGIFKRHAEALKPCRLEPKNSRRTPSETSNAKPRVRVKAVMRKPEPEPEPELEPEAPPEPLHLSLMDLERHHCRFPLGDGPHTFCGNERKQGSSYCSYHHNLTWAEAPKPKRKKKRADHDFTTNTWRLNR